MTEVFRNLIDGEWRESTNSTVNTNPSDTSDIIGRYADASNQDIDDAVASARDAQREWESKTPQTRADALENIAREIADRRDELAFQLSREEGKPLRESAGELTKTSHLFRYFAGEAVRCNGEHMRSIRDGIDIDVERRALGVVGLISPWNFPISIPAWKSAPALAFGNAVILKPSELTNASAWSLAEIADRHLPRGTFQLLMGDGRTGNSLVSHSGVDGVSFTGSVATGAKIAPAVQARHARLQMEMGGKNPLVICEDADIDGALDAAVKGAFFSAGQRCTACSRLIVHTRVHDQFVDKLTRAIQSLRVGHALDESSDIGPLVSADQLAKVQRYIRIGVDEGATLLWGGDELKDIGSGHYMRPALFVDTNSAQRINREEIFGPVASVIKVDDLDEAIAAANDVEFGLCAGIFTASIACAREFRKKVMSGMIMVNVPTVGTDYHAPFGGVRASSFGPREMGTYAREFYTVSKTVYVSS